MAEVISCPFCGFKGEEEYLIQLHIEEHHTEDSPFVVNETPYKTEIRTPALPPRPGSGLHSAASSRQPSDDNPWVKCTRPACGEYVHISDIQEHLEFHEAAAVSDDDGERKSSGRSTPHPPYAFLNCPSQNGESSRTPTMVRQFDDRHTDLDGYSNQADSKSPLSAAEAQATKSRKRSASDAETALSRSPQKPPRQSTTSSNGSSPQKLKRPSRPTSLNSSHSSQFKGTIIRYFAGASGPPDRRDNQPSLPPRPKQQRRVRPPLEPGRLGRRELGPHAFEEEMPAGVRSRLLNDALPKDRNRIGKDARIYRERVVDNETSGLIEEMSDISAADPDVVATYLCHPSVKHVEKINCDGNFCGYWNIQMLLTYIHHRDAQLNRMAPRHTPTVLAIQDVIEKAWDNGICSYGRIETGGVRNTRKWIGTHEALAFFTQVGVDVEALSFKTEATPSPSGSSSDTSTRSTTTNLAVTQLLDHVEAYFISDLENARHHRTTITTSLPPIYFQRLGHSMTIVGIERMADGSRNLLLFDPSYGTSGAMDRVLAGKKVSVTAGQLMRPYRRSEHGLSRWDEFEIIVPRTTQAQESQHKPK
jgi:zinc finger-containing ubiquitin peptidase 1